MDGKTDGTVVRLGQAAEMLGVSVDTVRRWADQGRLTSTRTGGGQRRVYLADVTALMSTRRADRAATATSARNAFPGVVTRVEADRVAAVVEIQAGPHRLVSLMTAEAVRELDLKPGDEVVGVVKATNVIVEVPARREHRD